VWRLVALFALLTLATASAGDGAVVQLNRHVNGTTVRVRAGDELQLKLSGAIPGAGFWWRFTATGAPVLHLDSEATASPPHAGLGTRATFDARFTVHGPGHARIALVLLGPGHTPAVGSRFAVSVIYAR
jgi:hypothetical protein